MSSKKMLLLLKIGRPSVALLYSPRFFRLQNGARINLPKFIPFLGGLATIVLSDILQKAVALLCEITELVFEPFQTLPAFIKVLLGEMGIFS